MIDPVSQQRLFGYADAFDSPITRWGTLAIAALLIVSPAIVMLLSAAGKIDAKNKRELLLRCASWAVIAPALLVPVLLGAAWWIVAVYGLSLLCFREYARITGLFRESIIMIVVYLGLTVTYFGALDHWYGLFIGATPVTLAVIAAAAVLSDRPKGYVQRVALGMMGFSLFGTGLGHLAFLGNDADYRALLFILIAAVEGNDIFAYLCGKTFGKRKLCPHTSPNKTIAGAIGAILCTTALVITLGHFIVPGGVAPWWPHLLAAGVLVSLSGMLGDLVLSSIKRDIGIKDTGTILPGHGGLLDRFDSILLAAPVVFYFLAWFRGVGLDQPVNIFTHFTSGL